MLHNIVEPLSFIMKFNRNFGKTLIFLMVGGGGQFQSILFRGDLVKFKILHFYKFIHKMF